MLTVPVFSKTSYSYLSNAYENSSFNFCVCLQQREFFSTVRIIWNLRFIFFLTSALIGVYKVNFPSLQSHKKCNFYKPSKLVTVLMNPLELHFCVNR